MKAASFAACVLLQACNVEAIQGNTGGVRDESVDPSGRCPSGMTVVLTDFSSTQVALTALDGTTLSPSFLSSSSKETDGLAFAFSGDVVLPEERPPSGRVVLIDRYGTNVITFADPATARVLGQVAVATGYEANPYDYIEVDDRRAYVSRFGHNPEPGLEPFDEGDDLLILDTRAFRIEGRIPLRRPEDVAPPRPTRFTRLGERILVMLERSNVEFTELLESELVGLDPLHDEIAWRLPLHGMKGCGTAVSSPDGSELLIACSGKLTRKGDVEDLTTAGIAILDATHDPPVLVDRVPAARFGDAIQSDLAFVDEHTVLLKTQTSLSGNSNNRLLAWHRLSGVATELLEARPNAEGRGLGVVYGSLVCDLGCSDVCWLADADRGLLRRIRVDDGELVVDGDVRVERRVGLPPRGIAYR